MPSWESERDWAEWAARAAQLQASGGSRRGEEGLQKGVRGAVKNPRNGTRNPRNDLTLEGFKLECVWLPLIPTSAPCTTQPKGSLGMNKGVLSNKWGEIQLIAAARKEGKEAWRWGWRRAMRNGAGREGKWAKGEGPKVGRE